MFLLWTVKYLSGVWRFRVTRPVFGLNELPPVEKSERWFEWRRCDCDLRQWASTSLKALDFHYRVCFLAYYSFQSVCTPLVSTSCSLLFAFWLIKHNAFSPGWNRRPYGNAVRNEIFPAEAASLSGIPSDSSARFLHDQNLPSQCWHVYWCHLRKHSEERLDFRNYFCTCLECHSLSLDYTIPWKQFEWWSGKTLYGELRRIRKAS